MTSYYHSPAATFSSLSSPTSSTRVNHENATSYHPVSSCGTKTPGVEIRLTNVFFQKKKADEVPSTVQNLLLSTKRLQDVLRLWSVEQATEGDVSDLYVQIGNQLNQTINAFAQHQIDMRYVVL